MLTLDDRVHITELLSGLDLDDLLSLASTVTQGLIKPVSKEEAIDAILLHSDSVESILSRKKVSRELIFTYLHWKNISTDNNLNKKSLSNICIEYWNEQLKQKYQPGKENENHSNSSTTEIQQNNSVNGLLNGSAVATQVEVGWVDLLANKFTEWFYQLLNKDFLEGGIFAMGPENFWTDASLHIKLKSNENITTEEAEGSSAIVELLNEIKQRHKLYFSANLTAQGVRGRVEPHGMVSVLACGTLHQSAGVVVGLFEQVFYLIKDPLSSNTWKIKRSQLELTSKLNVGAVPTLTEGELTKTLLPIENPD